MECYNETNLVFDPISMNSPGVVVILPYEGDRKGYCYLVSELYTFFKSRDIPMRITRGDVITSRLVFKLPYNGTWISEKSVRRLLCTDFKFFREQPDEFPTTITGGGGASRIHGASIVVHNLVPVNRAGNVIRNYDDEKEFRNCDALMNSLRNVNVRDVLEYADFMDEEEESRASSPELLGALSSRYTAVLRGDISQVREELERHNDQVYKNRALKMAVHDNLLEMARFLISQGATVNNDKFVIISAVQNGFYDMVRLLIDNGAIFGPGIMNSAVFSKNPDMILMFLQKGVSFREDKKEILEIAFKTRNDPLIQWILENSRIHDQTFLEQAVKADNYEMLKFLLDSGVKILNCENLILSSLLSPNTDIFHFLLVQCAWKISRGLLLQIIYRKSTKFIQIALEYGNPSLDSEKIIELVIIAMHKKKQVTLRFLLQKFPHTIRNNLRIQKVVENFAGILSKNEVVKILVPDFIESNNKMMHRAFSAGNFEIVEYLESLGISRTTLYSSP